MNKDEPETEEERDLLNPAEADQDAVSKVLGIFMGLPKMEKGD